MPRKIKHAAIKNPNTGHVDETSRAVEDPDTAPGLTEQLARSVLDSLSAHVAILDRNGVILETNAAWKNFAGANNIQMRPDTVNVNYLDICSSALGDSAEEAGDVYQGIRDLIDGRITEFVIEYPCHSTDEKRWFYMRATRLNLPGEIRVVVSHENITPLKKIEEALKQRERDLKDRERELEIKTRNLEDANTALKVLLKQRDRDKQEMEESLVANIREVVHPYLERLSRSRLDARQQAWLDITRSHLDTVISPFLGRLSSLTARLTPREIEVAVLVKEGRMNKEIADILGCSVDAVDFHRKNIRKKLGLTRRKVNLRAYLLSLT